MNFYDFYDVLPILVIIERRFVSSLLTGKMPIPHLSKID